MGFFDKNVNVGAGKKVKRVETALGRAATDIAGAINEYFYEPELRNPIPYIEKAVSDKLTYYGFYHDKDKNSEPFFLKEDETTMEIYVGSTGTGKGVLLGNKVLEAIKKRKGVIIIDPKTDGFLPQICLEELTRQGRPDDFLVASWPYNFGYDGINESDDYIAVANKLIDAFNLEESDNKGVDYYRKLARIMLKRALKLFFSGELGVLVKKDLNDIAFHTIKLAEDLKKQEELEKELSKNNPNYNKIEQLQKRYFNTDLLLKHNWDNTAVETLQSLAQNFEELLGGATIYKGFDLSGALHKGKVIYFRVDMLDIASLKMVKLMINDAIQLARANTADTIIIADELSFYANQTIAGALATVRSMGLKFLLALQDLAQMKDENIRNAILSNCNVKLFYKISDKLTLEYVEKIGGKEYVTSYSTSVSGQSNISQKQEDYLNATKIRALPRQKVAIVIAEALPKPEIIQTNFVKTSRQFDWAKYFLPKKATLAEIDAKYQNDPNKINFETKAKEAKKLLENSDLLAITFETMPI